jgi:uncharacterized protein (TIGR00730 family)
MKIAVFCGSYDGNSQEIQTATSTLAQMLVAKKCHVVYGGGASGLMGKLADTVIEHGGEITGVLPASLVDKELAHQGLSELIVVRNMHERKQKMSELSEAFIALPGAIGTLEEIVEQWTWALLGIHDKPIAFLNVGGFYDHLIQFFDEIRSKDLLSEAHLKMLIISDCPHELLEAISQYTPPPPKWSERRDGSIC